MTPLTIIGLCFFAAGPAGALASIFSLREIKPAEFWKLKAPFWLIFLLACFVMGALVGGYDAAFTRDVKQIKQERCK